LEKNRFKLIWLDFSGLGSIRFFWFYAYKTETEPVGFFKILINLIEFFLRFGFFSYFFSCLIGFSVVLLIPNSSIETLISFVMCRKAEGLPYQLIVIKPYLVIDPVK
jgi:hypothetical protein